MQIIFSNEHQTLLESLANLLALPPPGSALDEDWIVVPNRDTGRWLQAHLTERLGVVANTRFLSLEEAMDSLLPEPKDPTLETRLFWATAQRWVADHPTTPPEALADQVSRLTDFFWRCLYDRPDWLAAWEAGKQVVVGDHLHQSLWSAIQQQELTSIHTRRLGLAQGKHAPLTGTLGRLFVFCPDRISDLALHTLKRVSEDRLVALWVQSPSPEGWFLERNLEAQPLIDHSLADHSLLVELAQERARLMRQFIQESSVDGYQVPKLDQPSALAQLQRGLFLNQTSDLSHARDDSIHFYSATSPTEEVQALKKWLIDYLNQDPAHSLFDIAVVATDPGLYGPIVQRVFANLDASQHLPTASDPLILTPLLWAAADLLLDCKRLGFRANRLFAYFTTEAVRDHWGLTDRDIRDIEQWLNESGARRGLEGHRHSLDAARQRLLNGLMADPEQLIEADATLTEPIEQCHTLDCLIAALEGVDAFLKMPERLPLQDTLAIFNQCLRTLSLDALQAMELPGLDSETLAHPMPWTLLAAYIKSLDTRGLSRPVALGDQISVTSPQTIRAMSWPVVAVLGANDGTLPQDAQSHAWDLIAHNPRPGDAQPMDAERQAFVDILLNTQKHVWISWQGQHPISLEPELPAAAVMALLGALSPDTTQQMQWITPGEMGLPMPDGCAIPTVPMHGSPRMRTEWTQTDWIRTAIDPASAFLAAKGTALRAPPDDRLHQEPLKLSGLDKYRLRTLFAETGDTARIEMWLKQHPEFPEDLDPATLSQFTPAHVQEALRRPKSYFPPSILELGPYRIDLVQLATAQTPRITPDEAPEGQRTLGVYLDMLLCFCLNEDVLPIDMVTFGNKIYRMNALPQSEAKALATQWCEALAGAESEPCPLIAPLAIAHAEKLLKNPDASLDFPWGASPLLHRPQYRRLFADDPALESRHRNLVEMLVVPLVALRERRTRATL